jgi:hypothetical protein
MADLEHIRQKIAEISKQRKNVELSDIKWVVENLGRNGYATSAGVTITNIFLGLTLSVSACAITTPEASRLSLVTSKNSSKRCRI